MTDEKKKEYSMRIGSANPSEIVVILYDMLKDDLTDAASGNASDEGIDHAELVIGHLRASLDFSKDCFETSSQLLSLYDYVGRLLSKARLKSAGSADRGRLLDEALLVVAPLSEAFKEVAAKDLRPAAMANAEKTVAGMTYGRAGLSEETENYDRNRGFLA